MELRILFVGIGSIAKRHIKNLQKIANHEQIKISIDALRRQKVFDDIIEYNINNVYNDYSDIKTFYDIIFITNPTEYHISALKNVISLSDNFFIEKPIASFSQIDIAERIILPKNKIYYVACPLRYNSVIQYIKNNVKTEEVLYVRSISSSYLPEWRPNIDYRTTYSAHKNLGGGVSIDLIHEWDYLTYLFGIPSQVFYRFGKISNLEIDTEDFAEYIANYGNKIVSLHLDYYGRYTIREIMLITNEDTIIGDIANNKIHYLKSNKTFNFNEERNDYQIRELRHFLNIIIHKKNNDNDFYHAIQTLKLTQGVL